MGQLEQMEFDFEDKSNNEIDSSKEKKNVRDKDVNDFLVDMADVIHGPIIVPPSSWAESIPKDLKEDIFLERLISHIKKEQTATIPEVVAYLMPCSLEAPFDHKWTKIYTWCSAQYLNEYRKLDLSDIAPKELSADEKSELQRLRDFIYQKRREVVKKRIKALEKERLIESKEKQEHDNDFER